MATKPGVSLPTVIWTLSRSSLLMQMSSQAYRRPPPTALPAGQSVFAKLSSFFFLTHPPHKAIFLQDSFYLVMLDQRPSSVHHDFISMIDMGKGLASNLSYILWADG